MGRNPNTMTPSSDDQDWRLCYKGNNGRNEKEDLEDSKHRNIQQAVLKHRLEAQNRNEGEKIPNIDLP